VQKKIADAIILTGDALLPDKLNAKLKKSLAQFTADSDYAQVLVGDTADKYRKTLQKDLLGQAAIYDVMLQKLKAELKGKSPKQQAAIQTKIDSVQSSLEGVQQQVPLQLAGERAVPPVEGRHVVRQRHAAVR